MAEATKHNNGGSYGPHPGDCPACIEKYDAELIRRAALINPHRAGTKVHAAWERDNRRPSWFMDLRSESYWSM